MSAPITKRLHEHLHKLPGMPPHREADRLNQNRRAHHNHRVHRPALANPNGRHVKPPRILVAWQNWIGGLFTRRGARR